MTQAASPAVPAPATSSQAVVDASPAYTQRAESPGRAGLTSILIGLALLAAIVNFVATVSDYSKVFVHPEVYQFHLPQALRSGFDFGLHDVADALQFREVNESRPRWGSYLLQALDLKLRLRLYQWLPLPPTVAPITWFIQLVVAPYLLYRLLVLLTGDRVAAVAGLAVYVSAIGFLCGFTMSSLPGKSLSNTFYIAAFYFAARAVRRLRPGQALFQSSGASKYLLVATLLVGLFFDELPIFSFCLIPLTFWPHFVPVSAAPSQVRSTAANAAFLAAPAAAFLLIVVVVMPPIIQQQHGFEFDYLGSTLLINGNTRTGTSLVDGRFASMTPWTVLSNVTTLVGLSLVPWPISPLTPSPYGEYPGGQVDNVPKIVVLLAFFALLGLVAVRSRASYVLYFRGYLLALALFFLFLTGLSIRHIPIVTGYYYGAGFASLFAILIGLLVGCVSEMKPVARPFAALAVAAIVGAQIANFAPINAGWIYQHTEIMARDFMTKQLRPGLQRRLPLAPLRPLTITEVNGIWSAWHRDRMEAYIREHRLTTSAVYEVMELRALDRLTRNDDD